MKKINKTLILLSIVSTLFTSCFDPVFYNLNRDVKPEDKSVIGNIQSIARFNVDGKEFLVLAANGGLRYKLSDKGETRNKEISVTNSIFGTQTVETSWLTYSLPKDVYSPHSYDYYGDSGTTGHIGAQIIKVLADTSNLYLLTAEYDDSSDGTSSPSKLHLWSVKIPSVLEDGETWSSPESYIDLNKDNTYLTFYTTDSIYKSAFNVFGTNSINPEHRKVFVRQSNNDVNKIYKIEGNDLILCDPIVAEDDSTDTNPKINSVVYFDNDFLFFKSIASITNETKEKDADFVYYGDTTKLFYKKQGDTGYTEIESKANNNISCFAVTSDYLIIGCANYGTKYTSNGGFERAKLKDGIPESITSNFDTNLSVQIPSSYFIFTLLNTDPSKSELESTLYTSIGFITGGTTASVSFDSLGLWSYYPQRGNWNRE